MLTLLNSCQKVEMSPTRFSSTAACVVAPYARHRSPNIRNAKYFLNSCASVAKRRSTSRSASEEDVSQLDPASLVGSYEFAESTCYLSAVILTAFPDLLFLPLMPLGELPSFALASAATAGRVEAAFLVLLGSICGCLADASEKGNLTKSDTYKRLNLAVLLAGACTSGLTLGTYVFAENMRSPWLLLVMAFALVPVLPASFKGIQAQGLDSSEFLTRKLPQESQDLGQACITIQQPLKPLQLFYQSQLVLGLLVGVLLVALPSVIVEAPEPNYTAETLMRRCSGLGASIAAATAIWTLMGAASRGRLGASTFVQLNLTMGIVNVAIGFWIAWLATECTDTTALGAVPLSLIGVAPGSVYLYQAFEGYANKK